MKQRLSPPRVAERFLEWFCADHLLEEVQGDLAEAFQYRLKNSGALKARLNFYLDVLKFFKPSYIRKTNFTANQWPMIRNYFKISLRNLRKDAFYSWLNILGLAVGLCLSILIMRYVRFEQSYDSFHVNKDRVYRLVKELHINDFDTHEGVMGPYIFGELLRNELPDHIIVRIGKRRLTLSAGEKKFIEPNVFVMDPEATNVFTFEPISGSLESALKEPAGIIITEAMAEKYFGSEEPMGKIILVDGKYSYQVSAVVNSFPPNAHFHFDFIIPLESTRQFTQKSAYEEWGYTWLYTYVMAPPNVDKENLEYEIESIKSKYLAGSPVADRVFYYVQSLKDIHLKSNYEDEIEANGSELIVYGSMASGVIILLIACFNFMNLTTARATRRAKEVCVRKTVGAERSNLIVQFLMESGVLTLVSILIAILLAEVASPVFGLMIGKTIPSGWAAISHELPILAGGLVTVSLLAGSYPALYLSHFPPGQLINPQSGEKKYLGAVFIRKFLVVLQFGASIFLIIATLVVYLQIKYTQNKELGYNKENLIIVKLSNSESRDKAEFLKNEFSRIPGVRSVSVASDAPPNDLNSWRISSKDPSENLKAMIQVVACDYDYLKTLGLTLAEGRNFSKEYALDEQNAILINEAAVKAFGLSNPLGHEFDLMDGMKQGVVIGVVKDYHLGSLHQEIAPVLINILPSWNREIILRIQSEDLQSTVENLKSAWSENISGWPFEYSFLDENLDAKYRSEKRLGVSFMLFSILAITIACLGLFGLASFSMQQRIKEIGIRKAMGASVREIIPILTYDFLRLLAISIIVAFPIAYFQMSNWLKNFAFHIRLDWKLFMASAILGGSIAIITVGYHAIRAARSNPVKALRYE